MADRKTERVNERIEGRLCTCGCRAIRHDGYELESPLDPAIATGRCWGCGCTERNGRVCLVFTPATAQKGMGPRN